MGENEILMKTSVFHNDSESNALSTLIIILALVFFRTEGWLGKLTCDQKFFLIIGSVLLTIS